MLFRSEFLPDVGHGLRRGVHQVVGVEAVVAQGVGKYLERREIRRALEPFRQLLGGQPQRRLAHGVARQGIACMPYRADGQYDLLSGERPFDQLRERLDDLLHRKPSSGKFRGGPAVAVGDRFALTLVDPCRAESKDHPLGFQYRVSGTEQSPIDVG